MKSSRRFLSVFVVFALLLGAFSIPAAAADNGEYKFTIGLKESSSMTKTLSFYSGDTVDLTLYPDEQVIVNTSTYVKPFVTVQRADGAVLAKKGKEVTFSINNFLAYYTINYTADMKVQSEFMKKFSPTDLLVHYTDGSQELLNYYLTTTYDSSKNRYSWGGKFTPSKDIKFITIQGTYKFYERVGAGVVGNILQSVCLATDVPGAEFIIQSEEAGLLSGLLNWVKGISDKVNNMFDSVTQGFANIGKWFAELPAKLWEVISNGLKGLFVPDEQYMTEYSDHWDFLLGQRFGALYEVSDIIYDFIGGITNSDKTNTIYMPLVSLESVGIPFSFGGYDIKIVPSGFEIIVEVVKKIISALCTFMFINSLRKRYDEIMGVEQ